MIYRVFYMANSEIYKSHKRVQKKSFYDINHKINRPYCSNFVNEFKATITEKKWGF